MPAPESLPIPEVLAKAAAILRDEGATEVYVFGSFARGDVRPDSDLDLAVAGLASARIIPAMGRLWDACGRMTDIIQIEREPVFVRYLRSTGEWRRVA
jgi:predicted nucleotidyltransferase